MMWSGVSIAQRAAACIMLATTFFICPNAAAAQSLLPAARDLAADAKSIARSRVPLIVLVSLPGCAHCETVRRSHLLPLLREEPAAQQPLIRQVEINGTDRLRDFDGSMITHTAFARKHQIRIAPVVMFFDAAGKQAAEPLVGSMIPDFYGAHFDAALAESRSKLRTAASP